MTATSEADVAEALRIRSAPAPVTRISRKVLIGLGLVGSALVAGAVGWAMISRPPAKSSAELYQTSGQHPPDGFAALPKDYAGAPVPADVPKLGPPLPGDLGRPMLNARQTGTTPLAVLEGAPTTSTAQPSPAAQAREAALTSRLFASQDTVGVAAAKTSEAVGSPVAGPASDRVPKAADAASPGEVFDKRTTSEERLQPPASPYVVQAGSIIPAALITGLRSDLPGQITAQVTQDVYDSPTGRFLLIPQGARLVGSYDSQVSFGQSRVLLSWTRLILPGGRTLVLDKEPSADAGGFSGLEDGVDHHWRALFGAALLTTIMGIGAEAGATQSDSQILEALRQGAANSMNQVGQQVVGKSLSIPPTLTVRPGFPVRVMVTRDLVLEPVRR